MHVQLVGGDPSCQTPLYEISFLISLLSASSAPLSSSQESFFWLLDQICRLLYICSAVHSCNRVSLPHQAGRGQGEQKPLGFSVCSWDRVSCGREKLPSPRAYPPCSHCCCHRHWDGLGWGCECGMVSGRAWKRTKEAQAKTEKQCSWPLS